MTAADLTSADYQAALQALLPHGRVWPREPDAVQSRVAAGLAQTAARLHARANYLLRDAFPVAPLELLPEWEATLGLPDPCAGSAADQSMEQRQAAVAARFVGRGGQSVAYYTGVAAALGYQITITQFTPAVVGRARIGDPLAGAGWAHVWRVNAPETTVLVSRVGSARIGDRLREWGNNTLECALSRIRPAHTILQFAYGG
ncbi:MAG: DUF2313 domain-containing protein [Microbispora sp.]|nr:DUF2313 domain-containing protein [Microbispora sp.]